MQTTDGGYILAGSTYSFGAGSIDAWLLKYTGDGTLSWSRTVGGGNSDSANSVAQTADGGYIAAGRTESFGAGNYDIFLLKVAADGNLTWSHTAGSSGEEIAFSLAITSDGDYIVAGHTGSFGAGGDDVLLVKTDSSEDLPDCSLCASVAALTQVTTSSTSTDAPTVDVASTDPLTSNPTPTSNSPSPQSIFLCGLSPVIVASGGSSDDSAYSVAQTADGGYIVAGETSSWGAGFKDVLLIKYTRIGELSWARTAGGSGVDSASSVAQTTDDGYIVTGNTTSWGSGGEDVLLLKYASDGTLSWAKTAGGGASDKANAVAQTTDGGYIVAGSTFSYGAGNSDAFLLKYAGNGTLSWAKTAGGTGLEAANDVAQLASTGDYYIAGVTDSFGAGSADCLLVKFTNSGTYSGAFSFGGALWDEAKSIALGSVDGEYLLAGHTTSYGTGVEDVFLVGYNAATHWYRTVGGTNRDRANSVALVESGGFIVAGSTFSYGAGGSDALLLKYNVGGGLSWSRTAGGTGNDGASAVANTTDGGYVLAGETDGFKAALKDAFLVKTNAAGNTPGCQACVDTWVAIGAPVASAYILLNNITINSPTPGTSSPTPSSSSPSPVNHFVCNPPYSIYLPLVVK